ncbi:MAG: cyclohexanecarboxylate-CoA ligase, partial [Actinomycetota bacterium]|nr:cyclohexanecarboxylate-CoA ligase [Actinomycetota bacterium]
MTRAHPAPRQLGARWRAQGIWTDETLLDRFDAAPEAQLAIVDGDVRSTIGNLRAVAQGYAATLHDLGVRPGDIVCWQLPNWWEAVAFCWGVWRCGAIASPITPTLRKHEIGFILDRTNANVIAVPREFRGTDHDAMVRDTGFRGEIVV